MPSYIRLESAVPSPGDSCSLTITMMFSLAVALSLLTATLGLQIEQPTEAVRSSSPITITWTSEPDDPPFSIELVNDIFNNQFAIANNVQPSLGTLELTLPQVPPG